MRVKLAWLVRVGGARPPSFTTITITSKVAVYAPAEWADTLTLFHLYQYMYSVVPNTFKNSPSVQDNIQCSGWPCALQSFFWSAQGSSATWLCVDPTIITRYVNKHVNKPPKYLFSSVHSHAPSIRSHRGTKVVWPDFQPMRVPEEPVCIDLFRQNPVFTSMHLKSPVPVHRLCTLKET